MHVLVFTKVQTALTQNQSVQSEFDPCCGHKELNLSSATHVNCTFCSFFLCQGDEIHKGVFIIFFQGEQLKSRTRKICEGYVKF